jgi:retinol dehydrogenase 12
MQGKICLITGATSGIGLATAAALAHLGARIVLVGRDEARAKEALAQIRHDTPNAQLEVLTADLSSQDSLRRLADTFHQRYDRLDVLINNAGVSPNTRTLTIDGIETTFAVNHLAAFLLTYLLLDRLKTSALARIINVSSSAASRLDFENLQGEKSFDPMTIYGRSKMMNLLFTIELAQRLAGTGVTVNAVHPGVVRTNLVRDMRGPLRWILTAFAPFLRSPAQGAATSVYLASSPHVATVSGKYFVDNKAATPPAGADDAAAAQKLWETSAKLTSVPTTW